MKYKIALVRPYYNTTVVTPPLGLGYLSSYLKKFGYNVLIIDALKDNLKIADIFQILKNNEIDLLGINCLSSFYNEVVNLSLYIKENKEDIKVVIGGAHPTFLPYQTLSESKCDYVVCGEGENALKLLLDNQFNIEKKIMGVYSINELTSAETPFRKAEPVLVLDDLPFPDWEQMQPGTYPVAPHGMFIKSHPIGIISTSRGCPYPCKFCAGPNLYGYKTRFRSAGNVVNEIKLLMEKYKVREIQFCDDNFTLNRQHVVNICELVIKNNIKIHWSCPSGVRADKVDDELIKLMKKSGFYYSAIGIESANKNILKNINKMEELDIINNAIHILKKNKIEICGFFIFGLPGETKETIRETIEFALNNELTRASFHILNILPGCELFKELEGNFIYDFSENMNHMPNYIPEGLTKDDILKAQATAMKKFYFWLPVLLNCIRYIKFSYVIRLIKRLNNNHVLGGN